MPHLNILQINESENSLPYLLLIDWVTALCSVTSDGSCYLDNALLYRENRENKWHQTCNCPNPAEVIEQLKRPGSLFWEQLSNWDEKKAKELHCGDESQTGLSGLDWTRLFSAESRELCCLNKRCRKAPCFSQPVKTTFPLTIGLYYLNRYN